MTDRDKPLVWLHGSIKTPPFSREARLEAGFLLRQLQAGETISMPQARLMPAIGARCLELRVRDQHISWRIAVRVDGDAILVLEVFAKRTGRTPKQVIEVCRQRMHEYDRIIGG